jgi:hypothetical protein
MYIYSNISLNYSSNEKCFIQKLYRKANHTFYVQFLKSCVLLANVEKHGRAGQAKDDNEVRRTLFACWITKAIHALAHTESEYIILIAFPRQQWLRQRASVTLCVHCLSCGVCQARDNSYSCFTLL